MADRGIAEKRTLGTLQTMIHRSWTAAVAMVCLITGATVPGCTDDGATRAHSKPPSANDVLSGSCGLLDDEQVSAAIGVQLEGSQINPVSCGWNRPDESIPTVMVSVAPGTIDPGGDPATPTTEKAPTLQNVVTEWHQSALPSGTRLSASSKGWTVTVDVGPTAKSPARAAASIMDKTLERLPTAT